MVRSIFIWVILALGVLLLAACGGQAPSRALPTASAPIQPTGVPAQPTAAPSASPQSAAANSGCGTTADLTPAVTEGPYFKAGSPERASLLDPGMSGTQVVVTGFVLTPDCKPIAHALLDFWQANSKGNYDNSGYMLRGHLFTDAAGRYQVTTVVPGLYPGRTEHIHVKVQAPNGPVLTTQLFFPGVADNQRDGIFDAKLLLNVQNAGDGLAATFNFVVKTP
jgi:protocatechuate 3,4-dioxygenase beta subunit